MWLHALSSYVMLQPLYDIHLTNDEGYLNIQNAGMKCHCTWYVSSYTVSYVSLRNYLLTLSFLAYITLLGLCSTTFSQELPD